MYGYCVFPSLSVSLLDFFKGCVTAHAALTLPRRDRGDAKAASRRSLLRDLPLCIRIERCKISLGSVAAMFLVLTRT